MARVLGAVRLSHETDETTSPKTQRAKIQGWTEPHGHTPVHITEDLDISGAIAPFDRPELGPWLSDPELVEQWDIIVIAKLDRLSRSMLDFLTFCEWCKANDKTIVSVDESLDFTTPMGEAFMGMLMIFAQFERRMIAQRRADAAATMRLDARWGGGHVPYGYERYKKDSAWYLRPNRKQREVIRRIAQLRIDGHSRAYIVRQLNSENIPGPTGGPWIATSLAQMMTDPRLLGYVTHNAELVRDESGMAVRRKPLLDDSTWEQLQLAESRGGTRTTGLDREPSLLLRIAYCRCGSLMYNHRKTFTKQLKAGPKEYTYIDYICRKRVDGRECNQPSIRESVLDAIVSDWLLEMIGDQETMITIRHPASDTSRRRSELAEAIGHLQGLMVAEPASTAVWAASIVQLQAELDRLADTGDRAAWTEARPAGTLYRDHWEALDQAGRQAFLERAGVRAYVGGLPPGVLVQVPMDAAALADGPVLAHSGSGGLVYLDLGSLSQLRQLAAQASSE